MSKQDNLTIIFADVCRSTEIFEQYGDVKAREIISQCLNVLTQIVNKHGGRLIKTIGDEVMCTLPTASAGILAAAEMQKRVTSELELVRHTISIRVGLHYGNVVCEDDDVFGDAVNVAARMAGLAKAQQIVTTQSTATDVPSSAGIEVRSLGKTRVKGKLLPIDIVDIMWQEDTSNVTMVSAALNLDDLMTRMGLTIKFGEKVVDMKDSSPPVMMGRDRQNDLILDDEWVSRNHASIEYRQGHFILVDRSTNGTYVTSGQEDEMRVHRDEVHLGKSGIISLGQIKANREEQGLIRFETKSVL
jgi:class 3 adenylate cyclase